MTALLANLRSLKSIQSLDEAYLELVREGLRWYEDALAFVEHFGSETDELMSYSRARLGAIAGVPGWAMGVINGARTTVSVTMRIWLMPMWLRAAIVLGALVLTTAIIIAYWGHIQPVLRAVDELCQCCRSSGACDS